jgi:2'-5' RNA ligase
MVTPAREGEPPGSSLLVPVPEADSVIGRWRYAHDPLAAAGVPAHVTLIVPWLDPSGITPRVLADLDAVLRDVKAFEFDLTHVDWFGRRVLWAAPEPTEPFIDLIRRLSERYGTPPWGGQFEQVIPHLTIAHSGPGRNLVSVAADVAVRLPLRCRAGEVWVMVGGGETWKLVHRASLVS